MNWWRARRPRTAEAPKIMNPEPGLLGVPTSRSIASLITAPERIMRKRPVHRLASFFAIPSFQSFDPISPSPSDPVTSVGNTDPRSLQKGYYHLVQYSNNAADVRFLSAC